MQHTTLQKDSLLNETLPDEILNNLSNFFKVLGDLTRVKILFTLSKGELCVDDISKKLSMTPSSISHQLRILRTSQLVTSKKMGKMVIYSLADNHVETIFKQGLEHILE